MSSRPQVSRKCPPLLFPVLLLLALSPPHADARQPALHEMHIPRSERDYFSALAAADSNAFARRFASYFMLILSPEQQAAYRQQATLEAKKAFIQAFWKASNPNPLLPENDWLLEFNRRVAHAREHFPYYRPPYIDDRGKYFIRYGEPLRRFEDMGGNNRATFFNNEQVRSFFKLSAPLNYTVQANETWSYENITDRFIVHFIRQGRYYREITSLKEVIGDGTHVNQTVTESNSNHSREPNWGEWIWADLVKKRAAVSPTFSRAAARITNMEHSILFAISRPHVQHMFAEELAAPQSILRSQANEIDFTVKMARQRVPVAAHDPIQAENKIEFYDRLTQFRGPNGKTRLDITLLAPLERNVADKVKKSVRDTLRMVYSAMFRNAAFTPLLRDDQRQALPVGLAARQKLTHAVGRVMLLADPQPVELTLQVQESRRNRTGFRRSVLALRDFRGDSLMVSDIQLLIAVNKTQRALLPTIAIEAIPSAPYPEIEVRKKQPPLFYFEIYNLLASGLTGTLEIDYTISEFKNQVRGKASVSAGYSRPISSDNIQELIEVNLENVKKGWHIFEVTVRGKTRTGTIRTARQGIIIEVR